MNRQIKDIHTDFKKCLQPKFEKNTASTLSFLIIEFLYDLTRSKVIAFGDIIVEQKIEQEKEIVEKLFNNMPIEYVLGIKEFYGRDFVVNENVLIPRPETEELVRLIISETKIANPHILDIGSGSGAICVSLAAEINDAQVIGIDISCDALEVARVNAKNFNLDNIHFKECDILMCEDLEDKYDIIVSNPPYVTESEKREMKSNVLDYEPYIALFVKDSSPLIFYDKIATLALIALKEGGVLYFEINEYFSKDMCLMLEKKGFKDVRVVEDLFGKPRMTVARL